MQSSACWDQAVSIYTGAYYRRGESEGSGHSKIYPKNILLHLLVHLTPMFVFTSVLKMYFLLFRIFFLICVFMINNCGFMLQINPCKQHSISLQIPSLILLIPTPLLLIQNNLLALKGKKCTSIAIFFWRALIQQTYRSPKSICEWQIPMQWAA